MNNEQLFKLIDSLTQGQGALSKTPMGREVLFLTDPKMNKSGASVPENVDIQAIIRGMAKPNSPIQSQFSSMVGRFKLNKDASSKSIDDIIKEADLAQTLSKAQMDKTNVDTPTQVSTDDLSRMVGQSSDIKTVNDIVKYLVTVRPRFQIGDPSATEDLNNFFRIIQDSDAVPKSRKSM